MRARPVLPLLVALSAAALGCAPPAPARLARGIIGGAVDSGDPAVVLLVSYPADRSTFNTCTASIIAPTVLVTAAHCVDATTHPGHLFGAFLGHDASAYATAAELEPHLVAAASVVPHPSYSTTPPFTADIAVVLLATPVAVAPLPLRRTSPAPLVGSTARIVGYGQTVYGTFNAVKHAGSTTLAALDSGDTVTVGDTTVRSCIGDSGGPALVSVGGVETIVGVNSYSDTTGCVDPAHYRRVDLYLAFLDPYLTQMDGGAADGAAADGSTPDGGTPDGAAHDATGGDATAAADGATEPPARDAAIGDAGDAGGGGGCATTRASSAAPWLAALALGGAVATRRRRRAAGPPERPGDRAPAA